ncbi:Structural maintenance of chromosomes protein 1B [Sciurus carolinensis]|uniref:Structural maintenance of chromosomes protein 1B n=1 Tax=Sciurus carolinensis TaxID=30640 RepID=A0AA41NFA3_SCICA|nr:Structural maintenance of chromosomes protein 1B [Sciurus carolinensis]
MGRLDLLLVENFKSWRGRQVIGPFRRFTCIIGPNGSGKSNVMDALSFVMGEKTANLRVKNIQELIHGAHIGKPVSSSASVKIVYVEESGEEKTFARIIRGIFAIWFLRSLEALLNQKRPQYIKAKENTSHHLKKLDVSKKSIKDSERQCSKQEDDIRSLETELVDLDSAWRNFEKQIEEEILHKGRDIELEASQLDRYKELKEQVRKKVAIMTQQLEKLQWEQKAEKERLAFEKRRHGEVQGNLKQIKEQIEDHKKRIEKLEEYTKTCMDCLKEKKQQEESLVDEIRKTKSRMSEVNEELNLIRSELQNAGIDNHEGRRQQKRAEVLEHLKRLYPDSVFGRLLDLCHPIHKKYQLAVTKLFGRYMVAIVVVSEKVARDCIRFLKEERAEPETFLALDYLDIKPINERLREIKGCKMVIDVIKTQFPQLKKVIQFVCGNGLVCETVEEARHVAFGGPERRKDLMKSLRKETDLKQIQTLAQGTHTRLKYSQSELEMIKKKHLAAFYREQSQLQSELLNIESQCTMLNEGIKEQQQRIEEFQERIDKVEDDIFQHFCEEIGVANIREFENKHVKQQQEIDQKRLEFEKQKTRLNIQLEYSRNQLKKKLNKINTLKETVQKGREDIDNLKKAEEECLQVVDELMAKRQQLQNIFVTQNSNTEKVQTQIEEERKKFLAVDREVGKLQKEVVIIQTSLEQKRLEKHNMLLDCKVQDIEIVLLLGSLDDIIEVELGTEAESTQATTDIYEKEAAIEVDYSPLREDLKALQSDKEVEAHLTLLLQQMASQEDVLLKTAAPNLRALENLKTVRDKFQESTDDEVDAALDNTNIGKVSSYIKEQTQEQFQMIIISLKEEFYSRADALIGIYPEQDECMFSRVLTLDLSQYPDTEGREGSRRHRESQPVKT